MREAANGPRGCFPTARARESRDPSSICRRHPLSPPQAEKYEKLRKRFLEAVGSGEVDKARECLEKGVDVNREGYEGVTPLYWAARRDQIETAQLLIEARADVNRMKGPPCRGAEGGGTPLLEASYNGYRDMVKLLLKHGADRNIAGYASSDRGPGKPIDMARQKGHTEIVALLSS